jgi:hypothetical protein
VHVAALSTFGWHTVFAQYAVATQPASSAHEIAQLDPTQMNGSQLVVWPLTHPPRPSHCFPVNVEPEHWLSPHTVPEAYFRHAPAPSHMPSFAHVDGESIEQSLSASVPAFTLSHTPSLPPPFFAALHASQAPPQVWSQHTPSTQLPLMHCEPDAHGFPFAWSGTQWLLESQNAAATQSASEAHVTPQEPLLQM